MLHHYYIMVLTKQCHLQIIPSLHLCRINEVMSII